MNTFSNDKATRASLGCIRPKRLAQCSPEPRTGPRARYLVFPWRRPDTDRGRTVRHIERRPGAGLSLRALTGGDSVITVGPNQVNRVRRKGRRVSTLGTTRHGNETRGGHRRCLRCPRPGSRGQVWNFGYRRQDCLFRGQGCQAWIRPAGNRPSSRRIFGSTRSFSPRSGQRWENTWLASDRECVTGC